MNNWQTLTGETLRSAIRSYLFTFHNSVRTMTSQPITVNSAEECKQIYSKYVLTDATINAIKNNVSASIRLGKVKLDNWKRWFILLNQLKILAGIR